MEQKSIALPELNEGERYIGGLIAADGKVTHIILLPGDIEANWNDAMAWAKEQGGDLPNRVEQALLFATANEDFQEHAYWSNTECGDACAWVQYFTDGSQGRPRKYLDYRARAVRRSPI